jgi:hypothetical protein
LIGDVDIHLASFILPNELNWTSMLRLILTTLIVWGFAGSAKAVHSTHVASHHQTFDFLTNAEKFVAGYKVPVDSHRNVQDLDSANSLVQFELPTPSAITEENWGYVSSVWHKAYLFVFSGHSPPTMFS